MAKSILTVAIAMVAFPVLGHLLAKTAITISEVRHCRSGIHWHPKDETCFSFPRDVFRDITPDESWTGKRGPKRSEQYWEGFRAGLTRRRYGTNTWGVIGMPKEEEIIVEICKED